MNGWYEGKVVANEQAAAGLRALHVDVSGTPLVGTHSLPGQYIRLMLDRLGEGMFAIASGPGRSSSTFELLVKGGSEVSDALMQAPVGARVKLTAPEGPGFPIEQARGRCVLLFATGSGISAIRSLIEALRHDRAAYQDIILYFGARSPDAFAYQDEFESWRQSGIDIRLTVSRPGMPGWEGLEGYVQSHLPKCELRDVAAFVCGQPEMVAGVRSELRARGVPDSRIFENV